jgi:phosphate transport system permease protein
MSEQMDQQNRSDDLSEFEPKIPERERSGRIWLLVFQASTLVGIIALTALMLNILNSNFGYAAIEAKIPPEELAVDGVPLEEQSKEQLITVIEANVSAGKFRQLNREQPLEELSREEVYNIVQEEVVEPRVVNMWTMIESILNRQEVLAEAAIEYPNAEVQFVSWLRPGFLTTPQSSTPELAGVRTALLGSLYVIAVTILVAFPIGVGAAIYLEEYADKDNWFNNIIQTNINNLSGVPSIIYGMLGLFVFVRVLEPITSGYVFGYTTDATTANGRTILSAGLTLALLILPIIIIASQEAIRAVPNSLREASYGLGATKWQTVWNHVLPNAIAGILTGTILAVSRAFGETAPLVVVGASTFITFDPDSVFSKFTVLPMQIYQWTARPQATYRNIAAAAIIVLLVLLLTLNATAIYLRNRYQKTY